MTRADWNWQMETNVTGAFLLSREAAKVMMAKQSGAIVNIASYASYFAFPGIAGYTASKGALAQLTRTQALEAIKHGVRVNAIGVGDVVTNLLNHFMEDGRGFLAEHGTNAPDRSCRRPGGDRRDRRLPRPGPRQLHRWVGRHGRRRHERRRSADPCGCGPRRCASLCRPRPLPAHPGPVRPKHGHPGVAIALGAEKWI